MKCCLLVCGISMIGIGVTVIVAGYYMTVQHNAQFWTTRCNYSGYDFKVYSEGYHASVVTITEDRKVWYTHRQDVNPPWNTLDRQRDFYSRNYPIGLSVICYESDKQPLEFYQEDPVQMLWASSVCLFLGICLILVGIMFKEVESH